ncbi:MAG: hypothetical protein CO030_02050 [Candidatus Magasanikbacteria bacterium CG_4_9_14_0_2_um_filter_42_11]|uniref:SHS2 domain-containing protein n=1 Tax=Candidatus Magasanikbacteria bacterium CG_4_9_14_0_2_um_filter_42_11 TaxID=1974643 RepID=A0A2M8FA57_9BACT|nr:MAG: hypothetical protein COU34_00140 [Candidatus Magasanikbacteria bacterium CG10_big_fil_rev_8_21_14_0_10_43_9]PIY92777.1 MAG: hypothetical protein COY70_01480 [Candidatus Magasanikbacteria bacterium CG_4_10_14_0_8_um_filter_42_12]PJC52596.1 MAG: hypothetical protein CO030_02050 [Candidatus Magasanikbacteria bacterium CG_4_9_14_0_2_um_filter_42_11]
MLFHPYPNAFGLDIGDLSIKIVQLENKTGHKNTPSFHLKTVRQISLPPGLIVNGEIQEPEKIRKYIQHLLQGKKESKPIEGKWVVATLPEIHSFIKVIHLTKESKDVIDDDILLQAKQHIPFDEESYYLDWQMLPEIDPGTTRILIGAAPKYIVDMYTYLIESLGLGILSLEIEALAIARSLITSSKLYEGEARAILDVGATQSSLIMYDHETIQFSKTLPFSGELLTTAIMQSLKVSQEEAEKLKKTYGVTYTKKYGKALGVIKESLDMFIETIEQSFQFYYSHFPHTNTVTHVTMSGGATNTLHLAELLTERLGVTCAPGKVWKNLGSKPGNIPSETASLGLATAIGLALRAAENPFHAHDMI